MTKLIVRFMGSILELSAIFLVTAGGAVGMGIAFTTNAYLSALFFVPIGLICGFIVATIVLGIPFLILRINQNLEEINHRLKISNF